MAIADDLPPVPADASALEAAICNLITNAQKYGNGWMRLEVTKHHSEIQITVRDRGSGIPAHEQPHLFEPFYRGEAAKAAQIRGSGLGLSLVQQTVEAHGGRVSVESMAGEGSAFTIHLPGATS
jgi:signal transduction histidine kinase